MSAVVDFQSDPPAVWRRFGEVFGRLAFDVGANGGRVARMLAEGFDTVVAFEPAVESYGHLCSHLPENVIPVNAAVSNRSGKVLLEERAESVRLGELTTIGAGLGELEKDPWGERVGTREVRAVTLAEMAAEHGQPDFIKIDTEGHERAVIEGGVDVVRGCGMLLIEVHDADQGRWITDTLGGTFELVRHPGYTPGGPFYTEHFWLLRGIG